MLGAFSTWMPAIHFQLLPQYKHSWNYFIISNLVKNWFDEVGKSSIDWSFFFLAQLVLHKRYIRRFLKLSSIEVSQLNYSLIKKCVHMMFFFYQHIFSNVSEEYLGDQQPSSLQCIWKTYQWCESTYFQANQARLKYSIVFYCS